MVVLTCAVVFRQVFASVCLFPCPVVPTAALFASVSDLNLTRPPAGYADSSCAGPCHQGDDGPDAGLPQAVHQGGREEAAQDGHRLVALSPV